MTDFLGDTLKGTLDAERMQYDELETNGKSDLNNLEAFRLSTIDLKTVLENSEDATFVKSLENEIVLWSDGAQRVYGYSRDDILGRSVSVLIPPERYGEDQKILAEIVAGKTVRRYETQRVTKAGVSLNVLVTIVPIRDLQGAIIGALSTARDITEVRRAEETVRRLEAQMQSGALVLETANRVALNILAHRSGVEALRHIAEAARTLVGAKYGALGVARQDSRGLEEFVTVGLTNAEEAVIGPRPNGSGILGLLLERVEPLRIESIALHPASVGLPRGHPAMTTFLGVPILRGATVLGSLYLSDKIDGSNFTAADETAVMALGSYAAVAIHNLHMQSQQRALVRGLIHAQEEERRTVAYDLHDGLTQYIMASFAHLESFRRAKDSGNVERAERELATGVALLNNAVVESRRMINGLRSLALDDLGLAGALEQLLEEERGRSNWSDADLIHNIAGRRFDKTLETAVYRVAQEGVTNARKHAKATRVRLQLLLRPLAGSDIPRLELEVRDWGNGFDQEDNSRGYEHLGLRSMEERVHVIGGTYRISSKPGDGTVVRAVFPVLESSD